MSIYSAIAPIIALVAGILTLMRPRLLNYWVTARGSEPDSTIVVSF